MQIQSKIAILSICLGASLLLSQSLHLYRSIVAPQVQLSQSLNLIKKEKINLNSHKPKSKNSQNRSLKQSNIKTKRTPSGDLSDPLARSNEWQRRLDKKNQNSSQNQGNSNASSNNHQSRSFPTQYNIYDEHGNIDKAATLKNWRQLQRANFEESPVPRRPRPGLPPNSTESQTSSSESTTNNSTSLPITTNYVLPLKDQSLLGECTISKRYFDNILLARNPSNGYCWPNLEIDSIAQKIFNYLDIVNSRRPEFYLPPTIGVCVSMRESDFLPNIKSQINSQLGLFGIPQTLHENADSQLATLSNLPQFSNLSTKQYRQKMISTPIAQTEALHRVLHNISNELYGKNSPSIQQPSTHYWKSVLGTFNGCPSSNPKYNNSYAQRILSCHSCLQNKFKNKKFTDSPANSEIHTCLNQVFPETETLQKSETCPSVN